MGQIIDESFATASCFMDRESETQERVWGKKKGLQSLEGRNSGEFRDEREGGTWRVS